ncbi:MAG: hypothetical protein V4619_14315 [Bacteroidota bacterium]
MKYQVILRLTLAISVLTLVAASLGFMFIGSLLLLNITKLSFAASVVSTVLNVGSMMLSDYRQST